MSISRETMKGGNILYFVLIHFLTVGLLSTYKVPYLGTELQLNVTTKTNEINAFQNRTRNYSNSCDCGSYSTGCYYDRNDKKICNCGIGTAQTSYDSSGYCKECDCGKNAEKCYFDDDVKKCICKGSRKVQMTKCKDCDCGPNSISCRLDYLDYKRCVCKPGYKATDATFRDQTCKRCDCGSYSISCSLDMLNHVTCTCQNGYAEAGDSYYDKTCKKCDCGVHSTSCSFNYNGKRRCNCMTGYMSAYVGSWSDEGQCKRTGYVTGWQVGTFIISAVFIAVIGGMLIKICKRL